MADALPMTLEQEATHIKRLAARLFCDGAYARQGDLSELEAAVDRLRAETQKLTEECDAKIARLKQILSKDMDEMAAAHEDRQTAESERDAAIQAQKQAEPLIKLVGEITSCSNCDGSGRNAQGDCCRIPGHARNCKCTICQWKNALYRTEKEVSDMRQRAEHAKQERNLLRGALQKIDKNVSRILNDTPLHVFVAQSLVGILDIVRAAPAEMKLTEERDAAKQRAEQAEQERDRLREVLQKHHKWQLEIGTVIFPAQSATHKDENDQPAIELDLSAEYCDSSLYEETSAALEPKSANGAECERTTSPEATQENPDAGERAHERERIPFNEHKSIAELAAEQGVKPLSREEIDDLFEILGEALEGTSPAQTGEPAGAAPAFPHDLAHDWAACAVCGLHQDYWESLKNCPGKQGGAAPSEPQERQIDWDRLDIPGNPHMPEPQERVPEEQS